SVLLSLLNIVPENLNTIRCGTSLETSHKNLFPRAGTITGFLRNIPFTAFFANISGVTVKNLARQPAPFILCITFSLVFTGAGHKQLTLIPSSFTSSRREREKSSTEVLDAE